ncbi:helix-turn-helix domain-containing protein [Nocardioides carbamazepini]|uniref:helix-turn-helix domain-containing protein n=1 Tax=Nocardioides carbamazepini TaxID=2854259 RepID=UPI002149F1A2|nr:helix-turn-helix domain-containing protein [Nocardioides carbamazepini]MCR1781278.1 helix-turn-helix domain-containing protein [Nocardioides carbamazepini]
MDDPRSDPPGWPTESAITAFFDGQLLQGTSLERLIEQAAALVSSAVGRRRADGRGAARDARGGALSVVAPDGATASSVATGGLVWVDAKPGLLAAHFLDRLALTVTVVERWGISGASSISPPIDLLLDPSSSEVAQGWARKQLGLTAGALVRVAICSGQADRVDGFVATLGDIERVIARTTRRDKTVVLLAAADVGPVAVPGVPTGVRAAHGRVVEADHASTAYLTARDAYRFARPSLHDRGPYQPVAGVWLDGGRLSGLAALCRLDRTDIEIVPDVKSLATLAEQHGEHVLQMLEAYATTDSLRKAAAQVHVHHNSVTYWVQKAEAELGYSLTEPYRRAQLFICLCLYRLWQDDGGE